MIGCNLGRYKGEIKADNRRYVKYCLPLVRSVT